MGAALTHLLSSERRLSALPSNPSEPALTGAAHPLSSSALPSSLNLLLSSGSPPYLTYRSNIEDFHSFLPPNLLGSLQLTTAPNLLASANRPFTVSVGSPCISFAAAPGAASSLLLSASQLLRLVALSNSHNPNRTAGSIQEATSLFSERILSSSSSMSSSTSSSTSPTSSTSIMFRTWPAGAAPPTFIRWWPAGAHPSMESLNLAHTDLYTTTDALLTAERLPPALVEDFSSDDLEGSEDSSSTGIDITWAFSSPHNPQLLSLCLPHPQAALLFSCFTCIPNLLGFGVHVLFHDQSDWLEAFTFLKPHYIIRVLRSFPQRLFLISTSFAAANLIFSQFKSDTALLFAIFSSWSLSALLSSPSLLNFICPLDNCQVIILSFLVKPPSPTIHFLCDIAESHFGSVKETYFFPLLTRFTEA